MKLAYAIELGAICGLRTIEEAVRNADVHAVNVYLYKDIEAELSELYKEYDEHVAAGKPAEIPQELIDRLNKELDDALANPEKEDTCSYNQLSE